MPQPYRRKAELKWGVEALLERPLLSRHIAAIAHSWTELEQGWGMFLAAMLSESAVMGLTMYLSLNAAAAQGHMLNAIADSKLKGAFRATFRELWIEQRARAEERNRVVHGLWGYDPNRADFIALAERDAFPRSVAAIAQSFATSPRASPATPDYHPLTKASGAAQCSFPSGSF
jgi:hypothetical protein